MPSTPRTASELTTLLVEHLEFLRVSSTAFDQGTEAEAKRLAVSLRVLLHDTESSRSLLEQIGIKSKLAYFDSAEGIQDGNLLSTPGLVVLYPSRPDSVGPYYAPLDNLPPFRVAKRSGFEEWWESPVLRESDGTTWTRKQLVSMLANKEGGAHVHPTVVPRYQQLINENGMKIEFKDGEGNAVGMSNNIMLASVRQIAHELLKTAAMPAYVLATP